MTDSVFPVPRTNTDPIGWASRDTRNERVPDPRDAQLAALRVELAAVTERANEPNCADCGIGDATKNCTADCRRVNWQTTCENCARTLDASYTETMRAETAERDLAEARAQLAAVTTAMTKIAELHQPDLDPQLYPEEVGCDQCGGNGWPCATARAAALMEGTTE